MFNVTSAGAHVAQPFAPLYSACKAALHSYTVNLRFALRHTSRRVLELIPPAVQTALAGSGNPHSAPLEAYCDAVFAQRRAPCRGAVMLTDIGVGGSLWLPWGIGQRTIGHLGGIRAQAL
jgi:NAD(P)-dependent dehydrogenase (short-subunit alcohol dehydrogenase family)